jgi:uncharacterized protein YbjT (DUF2867 family)
MYAVAGVSGNTGSGVARTLLHRGLPVRVIVRKESNGAPWAAKGAEVAVADISDAEAMTRALTGTDGAYLLNPPFSKGDAFARASAVGAALARAAQASGIPKIVVLSSVGAQHEAGTGIIRTSHLMEQELSGKAPAVVFLRCSYFMENWAPMVGVVSATGNLPAFLQPVDRAIPMVDLEDIGRVAAETLLEDWTGTRVVELEGPARYTPSDVGTAFSKAIGSPVTVLPVPDTQWTSLMGMGGIPSAVIPHYIEMFQGLNNGTVDFEGAGASHIYGRVTLDEAIAHLVTR